MATTTAYNGAERRCSALSEDASLRLAGGALHSFRATNSLIECVNGRAWITVEGDASDHLLRAGEVFRVPQGCVVIQGVPEAQVRLFAA